MAQPRRLDISRALFALAGVLLGLYALDIALGMAAVKLGAATWRLSDVGEFVLVLTAMALFVAGLLADEAQQAGRSEGTQPTQGGRR